MPKFSGADVRAPIRAPVATMSAPADVVTAEGGPGWSRDARSELFLLAVANIVGERTFYEAGAARDARFEALIAQVTREDPDWVRRFVPFLRGEMNMRSASLVMAAEYVRAGGPKGRDVVASACVRADEPAEMLGYWIGRYGRRIPKPVKRGVADAAERLYTERAALRYDGESRGIRMADVLELAHPSARAPWQAELYRYLLAKRHGHEYEFVPVPGEPSAGWQAVPALEMIAANARLTGLDADAFRAAFGAAAVAAAGMTWEAASAKYGKLDARFWEAMIPSMGLFALVRNLRNFDEAGIGPAAVAAVQAKITSAPDIAASRMFPYRFYAAAREVNTLRWADALNTAVDLSTANLPSLPGKTLILVDGSGSMFNGSIGGERSKVARHEGAALFGALFAARADHPTLVAYDTRETVVPVPGAVAPLLLAERLVDAMRAHGGGTDTWGAVARHLGAHDRVVVITDEQAHPGFDVLPVVRTYTFNVAGYRAAHAPATGSHFTFGGLSDAAFGMIRLLERGQSADWPF